LPAHHAKDIRDSLCTGNDMAVWPRAAGERLRGEFVKPMTLADAPNLDQALERLLSALDRLELAATARLDSEQGLEPLEAELAVMRDDRSRLAVELDGALARNATLEHVTREVSERVGRAIRSVEAVLGDRREAEREARDSVP